MAMPSDQRPPRTRWPPGFPSVVIHAPESSVKKHADYWAAKRGDADAALRLVQATLSADAVGTLRGLIGNRRPTLVSAHALEREAVLPQVDPVHREPRAPRRLAQRDALAHRGIRAAVAEGKSLTEWALRPDIPATTIGEWLEHAFDAPLVDRALLNAGGAASALAPSVVMPLVADRLRADAASFGR